MPRNRFRAEVLTPEGELFNEEVEMVSTRTTVGSIGILARHEPLLATLVPTELRLYRTEGEIVRYAQAEGYLQVTDDRVLVLVTEAISPDRLDRAELEAKLQQARADADAAPEGSEERARARRDARRAEAFLAVAASAA